jgi:flagellar basal-body M-ring protein/flagellar hook-basal body protein (fliF)
MQKLAGIFRSFGPARLAIMGIAVAGLIGAFAWMIAGGSSPQMSLLYADLDMSDASRIASQLDAAKVPYRLGSDGTSIFVPNDQVARLRVSLAEQGLPTGGSMGYEIFDRTDALGSTNFLQNVNLVRALEGELARTMRSIDTVKSARVHLVIPQHELFSREKKEPSASVLLQMRGAARLTQAQVAAVQHLIASAVPGLTPSRISIIDGQGTLLTAGLDGEATDVATAEKADARRRQLEEKLTQAIEHMIERTVGPGSVRAEVFADMDFDRINTSQEVFDPDGQVVRSTQTVQENNASSERDGNTPVGVAPNLPDPNAAGNANTGSTNSENRNEETVNYEISKKVINHVKETGIVKRLSVAVLVDGKRSIDKDGNTVYEARTPEELEQLATLVRSAVGYNAERGDKVEVVNMRFADIEVPEQAEAPALPLGLERGDLLRLAQYLILFVLAVLVILLVIRPLIKRSVDAALPAAAGDASSQLLTEGGAAPGTTPALTGPQADAAGTELVRSDEDESPEEMIDLARVEGRVKASSLTRIGAIVERYPEESLSLIRSWLYAEE